MLLSKKEDDKGDEIDTSKQFLINEKKRVTSSGENQQINLSSNVRNLEAQNPGR